MPDNPSSSPPPKKNTTPSSNGIPQTGVISGVCKSHKGRPVRASPTHPRDEDGQKCSYEAGRNSKKHVQTGRREMNET